MIDLNNLLTKLRYSHPLRIVFDGLAKFGIQISPFYLFQEKLSPENPPKLPSGFKDYEASFWGPEEMKAMALIPGRPFSERDLLERIDTGQKCLGLKKDDDPVAFTWCDLKNFSYKWHKFSLKPGEAYLFDAYTHTAYRGKGIAPYLRYHLYKDLEKIGCKTLYSYSDYFNASAVRFKLKLRAKKEKLILCIVLFNKWSFRYLLKDYQKRLK